MKYIIKESSIHGVGCFATEDIKKGGVVASEPYFKFHRSHKDSLLKDYYWNSISSTGVSYNLIINGLGNYCNHKDDNNIKPELSNINDETRLINFIALKDIKKDEELFNNYGKNYWRTRSVEYKKKIAVETTIKKMNSLRTLKFI